MARGKDQDAPRRKTGRPAVVPLDVLETACRFNPSMDEVVEALRAQGCIVCASTVEKTIRREYGMSFSEFRDKRTAYTKIKLKQQAVKMALGGNVACLIFLMKTMCGMMENTPSGKDSGDDEAALNLRKLLADPETSVPALALAKALSKRTNGKRTAA